MAMTIMLVFIALAIAILIIKSTLQDELTQGCSNKAGISYQIDDIYTRGTAILCTSACPCNANSQLWPANVSSSLVTDPLGASQLIDCPTDTLTHHEKDKLLPTMQALEAAFKCAGICVVPELLLFSSVSQGPPVGNCKDELQKWINNNSGLYAGFLMAVGIFGMVAFSFSFLIFYMRKKGINTN